MGVRVSPGVEKAQGLGALGLLYSGEREPPAFAQQSMRRMRKELVEREAFAEFPEFRVSTFEMRESLPSSQHLIRRMTHSRRLATEQPDSRLLEEEQDSPGVEETQGDGNLCLVYVWRARTPRVCGRSSGQTRKSRRLAPAASNSPLLEEEADSPGVVEARDWMPWASSAFGGRDLRDSGHQRSRGPGPAPSRDASAATRHPSLTRFGDLPRIPSMLDILQSSQHGA